MSSSDGISDGLGMSFTFEGVGCEGSINSGNRSWQLDNIRVKFNDGTVINHDSHPVDLLEDDAVMIELGKTSSNISIEFKIWVHIQDVPISFTKGSTASIWCVLDVFVCITNF